MNARNLVGACLEMSQAETHPHRLKTQLFGPGEKNKLIGLARMAPRAVVRASLKHLSQDTLPLCHPVGSPQNYGAETTVFKLEQQCATPKVLKLYHSRFSSEDVAREHVLYQKQMQTYFGDMVVTAHFFVYQGRFSSEPCLGATQERVDGNCLFSEARQRVNPASLIALFQGTDQMVREHGLVPDFGGAGNVLVDSAGDLKIVDCGLPIAVDDIDITANLRPNLEWLAETYHDLVDAGQLAQSA